eukprot:GFUD01045273.1.p1 GENE.GFUD01045273.1~~GFUD01045273.1.p1  ORF type:complete len:211 (+),score=60.63 GFUD01045273.1:19-651(+)
MDADLCAGQAGQGLLWPFLLLLLTLFTFTLVVFILIFTGVNACQVRRREKMMESSHYEEELDSDSEGKYEFDEKYFNIPEEYINQRNNFIHSGRRFSSNSSGISSTTSSRLTGSDSQEAVDTMLNYFVNPNTEKNHQTDEEKALTMFGTPGQQLSGSKSSLKQGKETKKCRRISWPDEEKNVPAVGSYKHSRRTNSRRNTGLEVILEFDV